MREITRDPWQQPVPDPAPWRKLELMPTVWLTHYVRDWNTIVPETIADAMVVPANDKIPLLQTSKAVYADARPFLYLHHTFAFATGDWRVRQCDDDLSLGQKIDRQPLEWLTKVEVTNNKRYFPDPYTSEWKAEAYWQLFELEAYCPRLKHLVLELYLWSGPRHGAFDFLSNFSNRLSYLEIRAQGWNWGYGLKSNDLDRIAPVRHWIDGGMKKLEGYTIYYNGIQRPVHDIQQNTYILDRSKVAEQEHSRPAFERDGPYLRLMRHAGMAQA